MVLFLTIHWHHQLQANSLKLIFTFRPQPCSIYSKPNFLSSVLGMYILGIGAALMNDLVISTIYM